MTNEHFFLQQKKNKIKITGELRDVYFERLQEFKIISQDRMKQGCLMAVISLFIYLFILKTV